MRVIKVFKRTDKDIVRISCGCGYISFTDSTTNSDYLAWLHSKRHKKTRIEVYLNDILGDNEIRSARPGRPNGSAPTSTA